MDRDDEIFGPGWLDEVCAEARREFASWPKEMRDAVLGRTPRTESPEPSARRSLGSEEDIFGPGWLEEVFREVEEIVSSWPPEMQEAIRGRTAAADRSPAPRPAPGKPSSQTSRGLS